MMKKVSTCLIVLLALFLVGCDTGDAVNFNDKLVELQNSVSVETAKVDADSVADATLRLNKLKTIVKQKIDSIKILKGPENGEPLKQAMIDDFDQLVVMYDVLLKMQDENVTQQELNKLNDEKDAVYNRIEKLDEKVKEEQRIFAKKHNFRLEKR